MTLPGISTNEWASLMEGLVLGQYGVLLGAGASVGATNLAGEPLPTGNTLKSELERKYSIPKSPNSTLRGVYDLADKLARTRTLELPSTYLTRRFMGCSVPAWYEDFVRVPWNAIWNLNIDDVLKRAYAEIYRESARQDLTVTGWRDSEVVHRQPSAQVTGVHLHGQASKGDLIFGSLEYLQAATFGGAGHRLFWDSWNTRPMVIVGALLSDEFDMAAPLDEIKGAGGSPYPSILVAPSFDEFDRLRLSTSGLVLVESTGEDFFAAVRSSWDATVRAIDEEALSAADGVNPNLAYFNQHFNVLSDREDKAHDFYAGHDPRYTDILKNRDALRAIQPHVAEPLVVMPDGAVTVLVFEGTLSGTSTAALRFLRRCEEDGLRCRVYDSDASFNADSLAWAVERDPSLVIYVEGLDDFPDALSQFVEKCEKLNRTARVVSTSRPDRTKVLSAAAPHAISVVPVPDQLRDDEIRAVIDALSRNNRLNILLSMSPADRFNFFAKEHKRSLLGGMAAATLGRAFNERVRDEYQVALSTSGGNLARLILLSAELAQPLPETTVARALNLSIADLAFELGRTPLVALAYIGRGLLRPRHHSLSASAAKNLMTRRQRYNVTQQLAVALAPHISPSTISARTRPARITAILMDAERIFGWFSEDETDAWYEELYALYEWNSRYWEQRSLAELEKESPRFEVAEAWAREAISRHEDSYSLNTLGKVRLRWALSFNPLDVDLFEDGMEQVTAAKVKLTRPSEHPYVTALSYIHRAYKRVGSDASRSHLQRMHGHWAEDARMSPIWELPHSRTLLQEQIDQFLRTVAASDRKR